MCRSRRADDFYETHRTGPPPVRTRWGYRTMKPRDTALRLKRFEAAEKARKVASMETMVLDLEQVAADLARQIAAEEERTGIKDPAHFAYSTFAKAAAQRRANLLTSVADLRAKLDSAKRDHEEAVLELGQARAVGDPRRRPSARQARQQRPHDRLKANEIRFASVARARRDASPHSHTAHSRRATSPRAVTAIASCRRAIQRVVGPGFSILFADCLAASRGVVATSA